MGHPENENRDEEAQKQPVEIREQQSDDSDLPPATRDAENRFSQNNQPKAQVGNGAGEESARTASSAASKDRPKLSEVPQRSSRVRFSLDVERRPALPTPRTRSSLDVDRHSSRRTELSSAGHVSSGHGSSIEKEDDGSTVRLRKFSIAGQPEGSATDQSSQAVTSAKTLSARLETTSPTSGSDVTNKIISPATRNRGYSLRRMIFNRNISYPIEAPSAVPDHLSQIDGPHPDRSQSPSTNESLRKDGNAAYKVKTAVRRRQVNRRTKNGRQLPGVVAFAHKDFYLWRQARQTYMFRKLRCAFRFMRNFILRISEVPPSKDGRHIPLNISGSETLFDERTGKPYISNSICSTRYTLWNFLPRQLVAQFSKLANL